MPINRRINRTLVAWIAIFAILCHALMPSISRLHATSMAAILAEPCHHGEQAAGEAAAGKSDSSPIVKFNAPHCGFCVTGLSFAAPPAFAQAVAVSVAVFIAARLVSSPNPKSHRLSAAPPRGPPALA